MKYHKGPITIQLTLYSKYPNIILNAFNTILYVCSSSRNWSTNIHANIEQAHRRCMS